MGAGLVKRRGDVLCAMLSPALMAAAPPVGAPAPPLNNISLVQLGAPAANGLVTFLDLSTLPPRGPVVDVWVLRVGPTDVPLEPAQSRPGMGPSVGYWGQRRIDCAARTRGERYSAYLDIQGRIGPVWPFPPENVAITPGSQDERIYNAACQGNPPVGYPRVTTLTEAIGFARPAGPPVSMNLAKLSESASGATFLIDLSSIFRTANGRNGEAWVLAVFRADTVQSGVTVSGQWYRWAFDCQDQSLYMKSSAYLLPGGGAAKAVNRVEAATKVQAGTASSLMFDTVCKNTPVAAAAPRYNSAASAVTGSRATAP